MHGGASTPANSYVVPEAFPLEAGEIYYWRVRPRIQGDGDPLPWSATYVFLGAGIGRRQPVHWSHGVTVFQQTPTDTNSSGARGRWA